MSLNAPKPAKPVEPSKKTTASTPLGNIIFSREAIYVHVNGKQERLRADEAGFHAFFNLGVHAADFYLRNKREVEAAENRPGFLSKMFGFGKKHLAIPPAIVTSQPMSPPPTPALPMHGGQVPPLDKIFIEDENVVTKWADGKTITISIAKEEAAPLVENLQNAYMELRTLGIQNVIGIDGHRPKKFSLASLTAHLSPPSPNAPISSAGKPAAETGGSAGGAPTPSPGRAAQNSTKYKNTDDVVGWVFSEYKTDYYQFNKENGLSPYIRVKKGAEERIIWGVDFERVIDASGAKIGDVISAQFKGKQPVKVKKQIQDPNTGAVSWGWSEVTRNAWDMQVVEKAISPEAEKAGPSNSAANPKTEAVANNEAAPGPSDSAQPKTPKAAAGNVDEFERQISEVESRLATSTSAERSVFEDLPPKIPIPEVADLTPHDPVAGTAAPEPTMNQPPIFVELGEEQPGAALDGPPILNVKYNGKIKGVTIGSEAQAALRPRLLHGEIEKVAFVPPTPEEKKAEQRRIASVLLFGSTEPTPWPFPAAPGEKGRFTPGQRPLHVTINKAPTPADTAEPSI